MKQFLIMMKLEIERQLKLKRLENIRNRKDLLVHSSNRMLLSERSGSPISWFFAIFLFSATMVCRIHVSRTLATWILYGDCDVLREETRAERVHCLQTSLL